MRRDCNELSLSNDIQLQAMINGLNRKIRAHVILQKPTTVDEVEKQAELAEMSMVGMEEDNTVLLAIKNIQTKLEELSVASIHRGRDRSPSRDRSHRNTRDRSASYEGRRRSMHWDKRPMPYPSRSPRIRCLNCDGEYSQFHKCRALGKTCFYCGRLNHFQAACRAAKRSEPQKNK